MIKATDLKIGSRYKVVLDDCCIIGEFIAVLLKLENRWDGDDEPCLIFDNGVKLETYWACETTEEEV
jgi:hypothetical protein